MRLLWWLGVARDGNGLLNPRYYYGVAFLKLVLLLLITFTGTCIAQARLDLNSGDNRIVLIGNGFIEQSRVNGYLDERLMRSSLGRSLTCRNLGWSGDSVSGAARVAGFENPAGVDRLIKEATALKPTTIFVGYGMVESFDGPAGIEPFVRGYEALLDRLTKLTPNLVLISPTIQENDSQRNADLESYSTAVAQIAARRKLAYVDLFHAFTQFKRAHPRARLTSNGITLNDCGYWLAAREIEGQLGLAANPWCVEFTSSGRLIPSGPMTITSTSASHGIRFEMAEDALPEPAAPSMCEGLEVEPSGWIRISGLSKGQWIVRVDGEDVLTVDAKKLASGVSVSLESDRATAERLRQAIIHIDSLFYRRSRPFNDHSRHWTYIDKDYPLYDQQLAVEDAAIMEMRRPPVHRFEIVRKETPKK